MSTNIRINRICQFCNQEFEAKTTVTKFCSLKCAQRNYKAQKRAEKVEKSHKQTKAIIIKPQEDLKAKEFLSIAEVCQLVGVSRRTVYRCIDRGDLHIGKLGMRTIIRRTEIDKLFESPKPESYQKLKEQELMESEEVELLTITEAQEKWGISESALYNLLKRENIQKMKVGKYVYVPTLKLEKLLS